MSIKELREAVQAGGNYAHIDFFTPLDPLTEMGDLGIDGRNAYCGSLDAAKRLHDALLPGWVITIERVNSGQWMATLRLEPRVGTVRANDSDGARAWLLALLRALEEEGRDG